MLKAVPGLLSERINLLKVKSATGIAQEPSLSKPREEAINKEATATQSRIDVVVQDEAADKEVAAAQVGYSSTTPREPSTSTERSEFAREEEVPTTPSRVEVVVQEAVAKAAKAVDNEAMAAQAAQSARTARLAAQEKAAQAIAAAQKAQEHASRAETLAQEKASEERAQEDAARAEAQRLAQDEAENPQKTSESPTRESALERLHRAKRDILTGKLTYGSTSGALSDQVSAESPFAAVAKAAAAKAARAADDEAAAAQAAQAALAARTAAQEKAARAIAAAQKAQENAARAEALAQEKTNEEAARADQLSQVAPPVTSSSAAQHSHEPTNWSTPLSISERRRAFEQGSSSMSIQPSTSELREEDADAALHI